MRLAVFGEREPLDLLIQLLPQVVPDPLADTRREVLLPVRADGADDGDDHDSGDGGDERRLRTVARDERHDTALHAAGQRLVLHDVVEHDFDRPGLQHVREGFAGRRKEREGKREPVRAQPLPHQRDGGKMVGRNCLWQVVHDASMRSLCAASALLSFASAAL